MCLGFAKCYITKTQVVVSRFSHFISFRSHVINLDLSNTLEEFKLYNIVIDESSMKSLATLKQRKVLSFRLVKKICQNIHFLEALSSLDQLR